MLFAGWEVRMVKKVTEGLKMLPEAASQRAALFKPEVTVFHLTDRPQAGK